MGGQKEQVAGNPPAQSWDLASGAKGWKMPPGYAPLKENRDWRYK